MLNKSALISKSFLLPLVVSSMLLSACGSGDIIDLRGENQKAQPSFDPAGNYAGDVVIEMLVDSPKVSRTHADGRTNIVLQFIPRDSNGFSLTSDQISIQLKVDGEEIGAESHLQSTDTELQFDVNFGLVLDASYSMVDRQAFTPMLNAASQAVQAGIDIWKPKSGEFNFFTTWFDDYIYRRPFKCYMDS